MKNEKNSYFSNSFLLLVIILILSSSCKKNRLEGDYEKLAGEWEWIETSGGYFGMTFTPKSEGHTKSIEFKKKGRYKISENDSKIESGRILLREKEQGTAIDFYIKFKRDAIFGKSEFNWDGLYLEKGVFFEGVDTLGIADLTTDSFIHKYKRK